MTDRVHAKQNAEAAWARYSKARARYMKHHTHRNQEAFVKASEEADEAQERLQFSEDK